MEKLIEPRVDCAKCKRLKEFRDYNKEKYPDWHNAPVPSFGKSNSELLIVGLAPGLKGANKTGRPFTGDYAGDLLYSTLKKAKLSSGSYRSSINDELSLVNCTITNAVRCVPPQNKPIGSEIKNCSQYLRSTIKQHKNLKVIISLGHISHKSVISTLDKKQSNYKFKHGMIHIIDNISLIDSYHCSRYNTNTGRLTKKMFQKIFLLANKILKK